MPTKFSSTELFPALWPPTTAICGRSRFEFWPMEANASWSLFTSGMSSSIPRFPMAVRRAERQTGETESDRQAEELEAAGGGSDRQAGSSSETGRNAAVSRHDAVLSQLINPIS